MNEFKHSQRLVCWLKIICLKIKYPQWMTFGLEDYSIKIIIITTQSDLVSKQSLSKF